MSNCKSQFRCGSVLLDCFAMVLGKSQALYHPPGVWHMDCEAGLMLDHRLGAKPRGGPNAIRPRPLKDMSRWESSQIGWKISKKILEKCMCVFEKRMWNPPEPGGSEHPPENSASLRGSVGTPGTRRGCPGNHTATGGFCTTKCLVCVFKMLSDIGYLNG